MSVSAELRKGDSQKGIGRMMGPPVEFIMKGNRVPSDHSPRGNEARRIAPNGRDWTEESIQMGSLANRDAEID
jgi:hypothetical protein